MRIQSILRLFSRVTTSGRYIPEIDGLRFIAIFTVFLYHSGTQLKRLSNIDFKVPPTHTLLDWITSKGSLGVEIFFAISGFILALPFAQSYLKDAPKVNLKGYYIRRLTRLEPPYIVSLTLLFIFIVVSNTTPIKEATNHYLASLFYLHNIIYNKWSSINPVAWSLEVEVQFYLLAPFFFRLFLIQRSKLRHLIIVGLILLMISFNIFFESWLDYLHLRKSIIVYWSVFAIGILLADVYVCKVKIVEDIQKAFIDFLGILGLVLVFICPKVDSSILQIAGFHLGIGLLFFATLWGRWVNRILKKPVIATIGGMCYSIYLLHYALIALIAKYSSRVSVTQYYEVNYLVQVSIFALVVLVISSIFFISIEKPCMQKDWHKKIFHKNQTSLKESTVE